MPPLIRFSDIPRPASAACASRLAALTPSTSTRLAPRGLPDQGQPAATWSRRSSTSDARSTSVWRPARQAGAARDPADHGQIPESLIVCNGYKDREVHRDRAAEAEARPHADHRHGPLRARPRIQVSRDLGIRPHHRVRAKLAAKGGAAGSSPAGDRSKFGPHRRRADQTVERLRQENMLDHRADALPRRLADHQHRARSATR